MEVAIVMNPKDNVATAIADLEQADRVSVLVGDERVEVQLCEAIPFGHKLAIKPIDRGDDVIKYGETIGRSTANVAAGQHLHTHNIESRRGRGTRR